MRRFIYVDSAALPDYFLKVLETKKLLESGQTKSVTEAARANGISRSTYYKYKDAVLDDHSELAGKRATFMLSLRHEKGVLSNVLGLFSRTGVSVLTISQSLPVNDLASVMLSVDMSGANCSSEEILSEAEKLQGVRQIQLLAFS